MKIHLGCGKNYREGYTNVDVDESINADFHTDLNEPLPFANNSAEEIVSEHLIEHLTNLEGYINECWRVLKPSGVLKTRCPHFSSPYAWANPDHKRGIAFLMIQHWTKSYPPYNVSLRWRLLDAKLIWKRSEYVGRARPLVKMLEEPINFLINLYPSLAENFLAGYIGGIWELYWEMQPIKDECDHDWMELAYEGRRVMRCNRCCILKEKEG